MRLKYLTIHRINTPHTHTEYALMIRLLLVTRADDDRLRDLIHRDVVHVLRVRQVPDPELDRIMGIFPNQNRLHVNLSVRVAVWKPHLSVLTLWGDSRIPDAGIAAVDAGLPTSHCQSCCAPSIVLPLVLRTSRSSVRTSYSST